MVFSNSSLVDRFGPDASNLELHSDAPATHRQLAERASIRRFRSDAVPDQTLSRLCALALCAPTKSDLQQRDILIVDDPALRSRICTLLATGPLGQQWTSALPSLVIFCGNN